MKDASAALRKRLERLRKRYDVRFLGSDPLAFPRRFARADDREVVALVASALAYGNVKTIRGSLERVVSWMGPRPAEFARRLSAIDGVSQLQGFRHRWSRGRDVACLTYFVGQMLDDRGGIGSFFRAGYVPGDIGESLSSFSRRALALDHGGIYRSRRLPTDAGVRFFFTNPGTGASKRMNMFLRWMVRPDDGLDMGLWSFASTRELVIPLDTHIYRIGRRLSWTRRKTQDFKTALDITRSLAALDPEDPVKYDFALSRMGILEGCPRHRNAPRCELCELDRP